MQGNTAKWRALILQSRSPTASLVLTDSSQLTSDSQHLVDLNATESEDQHVMINLSNSQESHHPIEEPLPEERYDDYNYNTTGTSKKTSYRIKTYGREEQLTNFLSTGVTPCGYTELCTIQQRDPQGHYNPMYHASQSSEYREDRGYNTNGQDS
uniref:Uncharacterized protein n=1 Tax=Timema poppense TaxID=170557 RepID=A0A7R9CPH5_TIMPO|nr:unnamed protein product [Timema poppensis]